MTSVRWVAACGRIIFFVQEAAQFSRIAAASINGESFRQ
jgi:hypothetical protein